MACRMSVRTAALPGVVLSMAVLVLLAASCQQEQAPSGQSVGGFDAFVLDVADALAERDVERLVANSSRTVLTCTEGTTAQPGACEGRPAGSVAEGYDVKYLGREQTTLLGGTDYRLLLEGMMGNIDLSAASDEFGGPRLQIYSTLEPDPLVWFPEDDPAELPDRGDIAITYVGRSPSEDADSKRRLWVALAELGNDGWKIRLWLVGYFRADHPALHPSEENGFERWEP
jgi:hypothetical protein